MRKIILLAIIVLGSFSNLNAEEIKRITVGNKDAKITIIAFESLTCSHCANFHKNVYPELKKEYLDTGLAKIEFRHFPLDIAAFNASKVAQCNNDGNSKILHLLYEKQNDWTGRIRFGFGTVCPSSRLRVKINVFLFVPSSSSFRFFTVWTVCGASASGAPTHTAAGR